MKKNAVSSVEFSGRARVHIGLGARDIERSRDFYRTLLGVEPTKERPGYVKFEPDQPSVNLTLNQIGPDSARGLSSTHYGVQVKSSQEVEEATARLRRAGLSVKTEEQVACCYAVQDKVWAEDPDGNEWEVFVVTESDTPVRSSEESDCCREGQGESSCCSKAPVAASSDAVCCAEA